MDLEIVNNEGMSEEVYDYLTNTIINVKNKDFKGVVVNSSPMPYIEDSGTIVICFGDVPDSEGWTELTIGRKREIVAYFRNPYVLIRREYLTRKIDKHVESVMKSILLIVSKMKRAKPKISIRKTASEIKDLIYNSMDKEMEAKEVKIGTYKREVKNMSDNLHDYTNEVCSLVKQRNMLKKSIAKAKANDRGGYTSKVKGIMNIEGVRTICVVDGLITIITEPLTAIVQEGGDVVGRIYVGSFRITWGVGQGIRIRNLEKRSSYNYDHPHISDGQPCWGNMDEIEKLAANMEIEVAVSMMISYLKSVSMGDEHEDWEDWRDNWR